VKCAIVGLGSAIGYVTSNQRHEGKTEEILTKRRCVYEEARRKHPERWRSNTRNWDSPDVVFLNPEDPANTVTGSAKSLRRNERKTGFPLKAGPLILAHGAGAVYLICRVRDKYDFHH